MEIYVDIRSFQKPRKSGPVFHARITGEGDLAGDARPEPAGDGLLFAVGALPQQPGPARQGEE